MFCRCIETLGACIQMCAVRILDGGATSLQANNDNDACDLSVIPEPKVRVRGLGKGEEGVEDQK